MPLNNFEQVNKICQKLQLLNLTKSERSFSKDYLGANCTSLFGAYKSANLPLGVKHLGKLLYTLKSIESKELWNGRYITQYQKTQIGLMKGAVANLLAESFQQKSSVNEILVLD